MNILVIEDEVAAAKQLQKMIGEIDPAYSVVAVTESVQETVLWLNNNARPDLIISDIQLADGVSFEIFNQVKVATPVIFTTAYNNYMQNAFKVNSIDYLLKPIDKEELRLAFIKHNSFAQYHYDHALNNKLRAILQHVDTGKQYYKARFLVKAGDRLSTVATEEIAFLKADDRIVFLHTLKGQKYILDDSLDTLETVLDPHTFFRLNRRYIAPLKSIEKIQNHFNGRLKIWLQNCGDQEIFVSKEKANAFKKWLDQ